MPAGQDIVAELNAAPNLVIEAGEHPDELAADLLRESGIVVEHSGRLAVGGTFVDGSD